MNAGTSRTPITTPYSSSMDSELEHRLTNFLYQRGVPGRDRVRLDANGGVVAVSGELPTQYAKWLCIECCRRVAGVIKVIDNMQIHLAVAELPTSAHITAAPARRWQNRRNTSHHIMTFERATNGSVGATQRPRLLTAA